MGCKRLNTDFFTFLEIVHSKKSASEEKKRINYYPFGLKHRGYNNIVSSLGNSVAQKYSYNGKEHNQELGLDWYDYGARNYDASLGRWMNIDPLAENYLDMSPYNYVANNPIFYIDPDGMKIKDPDKVAEKYKNHLNSTAAAIKSFVKSGAISAEAGGKLTSFTSSELKKIDKLEKSDQVYTFSSKTTSKEGSVQYDASTEEVKVTVGKGDVGLIGHELNHAYQFEKGDISIIADNSGYGSLYDVGDETESYNVERMANSGPLNIHKPWKNADVLNFGKTKMSPPAYQTLPTISIKLKSKQGKALRKRTIEAGKNGTPVKEVYIGWQKDYAKGAKQKK
jgi:RHS repeat-associated protein